MVLRGVSFDDYLYDLNNNRAAFLAKYSFEGKFNWVKTNYTDIHSESLAITVNELDEVIIAGGYFFKNPKTIVFLTKYNSEGAIIFDRLFDVQVPGTSYFAGVNKKLLDVRSSGSNLFLAISTFGKYGIDHLRDSLTTLDNLVVKFNELGYPQWKKTSGGGGNDWAKLLSIYENIVYVGGNYSSLKASFDKHEIVNNSGNGDQDFFITRLDDNTSNLCPEAPYTVSYSSNQFCSADSLELKINSKYAVYVNWYNGPNLIKSGYSNSIYIREAGSYWAHVNSATRCSAYTDTVKISSEEKYSSNDNVKILPSPILTIKGNKSSCSELEIFSTSYDARYKYQWKASLAEYITSSSKDSITLRWTTDGAARVMVTVTDQVSGCAVTDSINVDVQRIQKPGITKKDGTLKTSATGTYQWFLNNEPIEKGNGAEVIPENKGYYKVKLTTANNCSFTSDSVYIEGPTGIENLKHEDIYLAPNPTTAVVKVYNFNGKITRDIIAVYDLAGKKIKTVLKDGELDLSLYKAGVYIIRLDLPSKNRFFRILKE